ncbi:hypothetical protein PUN28_017343 [Cardiocondyla obscurior]|uniref:Uncharacterized protein n=1 Tax=Cardiocondyla obscurior TaxID=286306 RepID=A0AAW2EQ88_9HYME
MLILQLPACSPFIKSEFYTKLILIASVPKADSDGVTGDRLAGGAAHLLHLFFFLPRPQHTILTSRLAEAFLVCTYVPTRHVNIIYTFCILYIHFYPFVTPIRAYRYGAHGTPCCYYFTGDCHHICMIRRNAFEFSVSNILFNPRDLILTAKSEYFILPFAPGNIYSDNELSFPRLFILDSMKLDALTWMLDIHVSIFSFSFFSFFLFLRDMTPGHDNARNNVRFNNCDLIRTTKCNTTFSLDFRRAPMILKSNWIAIRMTVVADSAAGGHVAERRVMKSALREEGESGRANAGGP